MNKVTIVSSGAQPGFDNTGKLTVNVSLVAIHWPHGVCKGYRMFVWRAVDGKERNIAGAIVVSGIPKGNLLRSVDAEIERGKLDDVGAAIGSMYDEVDAFVRSCATDKDIIEGLLAKFDKDDDVAQIEAIDVIEDFMTTRRMVDGICDSLFEGRANKKELMVVPRDALAAIANESHNEVMPTAETMQEVAAMLKAIIEVVFSDNDSKDDDENYDDIADMTAALNRTIDTYKIPRMKEMLMALAAKGNKLIREDFDLALKTIGVDFSFPDGPITSASVAAAMHAICDAAPRLTAIEDEREAKRLADYTTNAICYLMALVERLLDEREAKHAA